MNPTKPLLLLSAAAAGFLFADSGVLTASNSLPSSSVVQGYASQTITGVTATSVDYVLNTAKDTVTAVDLTLSGDTTDRTIQIAFNDAAPATCSDSGTYDGTTSTTYACTVSQSVGSATKFALVAQ